MPTIKSYTDIEQSKKLSEILPLTSADMHYERAYFEKKQSDWFIALGRPIKSDDILPCWSLAALLEVLPKDIEGSNKLRIDIDNVDFSIWYDDLKGYGASDKLPDTISKEPVDACVEMILKLKENNKL